MKVNLVLPICEGEDDGKVYPVNVGSGLTDDNRDEFLTSKDKLIGQIVEVRAPYIYSKNPRHRK